MSSKLDTFYRTLLLSLKLSLPFKRLGLMRVSLIKRGNVLHLLHVCIKVKNYETVK